MKYPVPVSTLLWLMSVLCSSCCQYSAVTAVSTLQWLLSVLCSDCCQYSAMTAVSTLQWLLPVLCSSCCQYSAITAVSTLQWLLPVLCSSCCQYSAMTAVSTLQWLLWCSAFSKGINPLHAVMWSTCDVFNWTRILYLMLLEPRLVCRSPLQMHIAEFAYYRWRLPRLI